MQISATIADWDYFSSHCGEPWSELDETKSKCSVFTLRNDSFIENCDFAEFYLVQRSKLSPQFVPSLDRFLVNCTTDVSEPLGLSPDFDLANKMDGIWSALSPDTVQRRLVAIVSDQECLLCDTLRLLEKHVGDSTGRTDPVIESPRDVYEFLQLWIGVHAEALATSRGFMVTIN